MATQNGDMVTVPKPKTGGVMYGAPAGTTLPTDATTPLAEAFVALGYLGPDGVTNNEEIESADVVMYGGDIALTHQTSRKETFDQAFMQTLDPDVLKEFYGVGNVTTENGVTVVRHNAAPNGRRVYVQEFVHSNGMIQRTVIAEGELFRSGGVQSQNGEARSFQSSVTAYPHATWGGDTARDYYAMPVAP